MKSISVLLPILFATTSVFAAPLMPIDPGMTWRYKMTHEAGEQFDFPNLPPDAGGRIQTEVAYRLDGTQNVDGKDLLKFEMHRDGLVSNTDFMTVDEHSVSCWQRVGLHGETTKLTPPQPMVATPLNPGTTWEFAAKVGPDDVRQHYAVLGDEDVTVPAGKFHAAHIHAQQKSPNEMTIDRWFVKGLGIVKDITATRNSEGDLTSRITLELLENPKVAPRPELKSQILLGTTGKDGAGPQVSEFGPKDDKICARWHGRGLPEGANVRVVWIAENVGDVAPPNTTIDDAKATVTAPDSHGVFTLSRPEQGWAPGDYRVEFYLNDDLGCTARLKITK